MNFEADFVACRDFLSERKKEKKNDSMDYKIVGNGSADIIHEIEKLKSDKKEIENRIGQLEAQLKVDEAAEMEANQACSSFHSILDGRSVSSNGLTPGMIYRYSRHLLLPDFGVEGASFLEIFLHVSLTYLGFLLPPYWHSSTMQFYGSTLVNVLLNIQCSTWKVIV